MFVHTVIMVIEPHMKQGRQHKLISTIFLATSITKKLDHNNSSFIPKDSIKPSMIITEDSNSGNDFFSKTCNSNIKCISAKGKSKVYKSIVDNPNERGLLVIVDGAAFGCEMEAVIQCMKEYKNGKVYLYTPESFEWLILKSGIISVSQNKLEDTYNYIESKDYFSWENYFCSLLKETTADTKYKYAKKSLIRYM